jgi:hypothetical protein
MCSRLNYKPPARSSVWLGVICFGERLYAQIMRHHPTSRYFVRRSFYPPLPFRPEPAPVGAQLTSRPALLLYVFNP